MAGDELAGDEGFDLKNQRLWCIFLMACALGVTVYQVRAGGRRACHAAQAATLRAWPSPWEWPRLLCSALLSRFLGVVCARSRSEATTRE